VAGQSRMYVRDRTGLAWDRAGMFFRGIITASAGLAVGAFTIGPLLLWGFGEPLDFNSNYSSRPATFQALIAHGIALFLTYFVLGAARGITSRSSRPGASWAANPLTLGSGYWIYRMAFAAVLPYEYFGSIGWAFVSVITPIPLAGAVRAGGLVSRRNLRQSRR
jgi:hypothetical protein